MDVKIFFEFISAIAISHLLAGAEVHMEVEAAALVDDGHVEAAEAGEAYSVAGGDPFKHVDALKH